MKLTLLIATAAVLGPWAGTSAPDGELDDIEPTPLTAIEIEGTVVDSSPHGVILVASAPENSNEVCAMDTSGDELDCWQIDDRPQFNTAIDWSPDGSRAVFDQASGPGAARSAIRMLDVSTGELTALSNPTEDGATSHADIMPAWIDDDHVAFVRVTQEWDGSVSASAMRTSIDGDETVETHRLSIAPDTIRTQDAVVVGTSYLLQVQVADGESELIAIDEDGDESVVSSSSLPLLATQAVSADRQRALAVSYDFTNGEESLGPLRLVEASLEVAQATDVHAVTATFDPSGHLVAAIEVDNPGDGGVAVLTLWDPESDEHQRVSELDVAAVGIAWTDDDTLIAWGDHAWQVIELKRPA